MIVVRNIRSRPHDPVAQIEQRLESHGIAWCVLRSREFEVDVLVDAEDRSRFDALLLELGYRMAPVLSATGTSADRDRRFHFKRYRDGWFVIESMTTWAFDPRGGHSHRWVVPGLSEAILDATRRRAPVSDSARIAHHLGCVLHEVINRGATRRDKLSGALIRLGAADPAGSVTTRLLSREAADLVKESFTEVASEVEAGTPTRFDRLRAGLIQGVRAASMRSPVAHASRQWQGFVDRLVRRRLGRRQVSIAFLGPDGVGKTSICREIIQSEPPPRVVWRYHYNGRPKLTGARLAARRMVKSVVFAFEALRGVSGGGRIPVADLVCLSEMRLKRVEGALRAWRTRLHGHHLLDVFVLDRGLMDEAARIESPPALERARRMLARPRAGTETYSILLVDDPQAVHARKDELDEPEIAAAIARLRSGLERLVSKDAWTEVTRQDLDLTASAEVCRERVLDRVLREDPVATESRTVKRPTAGSAEAGATRSGGRVHFFVLGFPGPGEHVRDGVHRAVDGIVGALAGQQRPVQILAKSDADAHYRRHGYPVRTFSGGGSLRLPESLKTYVATCPTGDLFVLNGMFNPAMFAMYRYLRRTGRRYVFVPHQPYNAEVFASSGLRKRIWWRLAERRILRDAEAIQVLDPRHGQLLTELGVRTHGFALPNGFDPTRLEQPHAPVRTHAGRARLFYFGRIDARYKGLDLLLHAVAHERESELTLQGPDWGDRRSLEDLADELGIRDRVRFRDPDYETPPAFLMSEFDIVCLPSRCEGFGLSVLEAMLAERPVLISDVGGLTEIVRKSGCGVVVEPTADGVVAGLREAIRLKPHWREMGHAGRIWAERHLSWEAIAADTWTRYERILTGADRNPVGT